MTYNQFLFVKKNVLQFTARITETVTCTMPHKKKGSPKKVQIA